MKNINILLLDKEVSTMSKLELLSMSYSKLLIFNSYHGNPLDVYDSNTIDIVIADLSKQNDIDTMDAILQINPKQKVLALNKRLPCYIKNNCDFCKEKHNIKMMLKPISDESLYEYINEFESIECDYIYYYNNAKLYLPNLFNSFYCYQYDNKSKTILLKEDNNSSFYSSKEFIDICSSLTELNIKHNLVNKNQIEVI